MAPATPGIPGQAPEVPSRHSAERRETLPTARDGHKIPQTRAAPATPDEFQTTEEQKWAIPTMLIHSMKSTIK